jgi:hypothetical protein
MTTITSPGGTPSVTYNASGKTVIDVTAASGGQSGATTFSTYSGWTIVLVTASAGGLGVILPNSASIGDIIELHLTRSDITVYAYPESGGNINATGIDNGVEFMQAVFTKVADNTWYSWGEVENS